MSEPPATGEPTSYRINDDRDQVASEQARLYTLARVVDGGTREVLTRIGIASGWHCCDIGSGAGTIVAWMAEQVGPTGRVVSIDVDTRFQPPSAGVLEVRNLDVTHEPFGTDEYDVVHARGLLQHLAQREAVLDAMIAATKPGGWVVVGDVDWIEFDAQLRARAVLDAVTSAPRAERRATRIRRHLGPACSCAHSATRGLRETDARGDVWTMHGGTDSAEWYVAALERVLDVLPPDVFPGRLRPARGDRPGADPDFAILSPVAITAIGRKPAC